MKLFYSKCTD